MTSDQFKRPVETYKALPCVILLQHSRMDSLVRYIQEGHYVEKITNLFWT